MNLTIKDATKIMQGQLILGDPMITATSAAIDSRAVERGALFFAFHGEKADGHDFVQAAGRSGAVGVVVSQLDWLKDNAAFGAAIIRVADVQAALRLLGQFLRSGFKGPVVGITGSNGKTTTNQMVASVLGNLSPGLSTTGNLNSQIGLPLILSRIKPGDKWMALEMGASAPGNIASLAEVARPTVGVLTSIGPAHLATFGSLTRIAESKWELMESLPSDGCAVVPWGESLLDPLVRSFKKKIVFFGQVSSCPVRASAIDSGEQTRFMLHIGSESAPVRLCLPGRHNVMNALAAAAAGWTLGCSLQNIVTGLENFDPPKMRMQILPHPSGAIFINDAYNANPASAALSIRTLVEMYPKRKRVLVLGSMLELGPESEKYHFHLGVDLAHFSFDHVYLVGEETKSIQEGAVSSGAPAKLFSWRARAEGLAEELRSKLEPNTVFLFKGSRGIQLEKAIDPLFNSQLPMAKVT